MKIKLLNPAHRKRAKRYVQFFWTIFRKLTIKLDIENGDISDKKG